MPLIEMRFSNSRNSTTGATYMLYRWISHNVAAMLLKLRCIYKVNTTLFCNIVGTFGCNVVLYVVATLLVCLFYNIVKMTFSQRCTTLYLRCVFAG